MKKVTSSEKKKWSDACNAW